MENRLSAQGGYINMAPKKKNKQKKETPFEFDYSDIEDVYNSTAQKWGSTRKDDWSYDYDSDSYGNNDW
jgi:hypothetical protein